MALKDSYVLNKEKAFTTGHRVEFYNELGDVVGHIDVLYAGPSNKVFTARKNAFFKPYERKIVAGNMPVAESDKLTQQLFIEAGIIPGWSEAAPLTVESFRAAMEDSPEQWSDLLTTAYNAKFYAAVTLLAETGN